MRFLRSGEITAEGGVTAESEVHVNESIHEGMMKSSQLVRGDVLIAIVGATIGSTGIYNRDEPANINQAIAAVRLRDASVSREFARWYLHSRLGQRLLDFFKRPVARANINLEEVGEIPLLIPNDGKQRELVAAMDAARAERRAKLAEANALLAGLDGFLLATLGLTPPPADDRKVFGISKRNLTGLGRIDPGYHHPRFRVVDSSLAKCPHPLLSVGKLCEPLVGGATPTKGDQDAYTDSGVRFLRILNVTANEFDFSALNFIRPTVHEQELKRSQLAADDVLMTITGRVGTAAVVTADILPANINQHIVRLRLKDPDCLPEYLAAYLNSSFGTAISNRGVTGGTRIALDYGAIQSLPIPVPPFAVQQTVVAEVHRRREEARRLRAEAEAGWQAAKRWFEEQLLGNAK